MVAANADLIQMDFFMCIGLGVFKINTARESFFTNQTSTAADELHGAKLSRDWKTEMHYSPGCMNE